MYKSNIPKSKHQKYVDISAINSFGHWYSSIFIGLLYGESSGKYFSNTSETFIWTGNTLFINGEKIIEEFLKEPRNKKSIEELIEKTELQKYIEKNSTNLISSKMVEILMFLSGKTYEKPEFLKTITQEEHQEKVSEIYAIDDNQYIIDNYLNKKQ